MNQTCMIWLQRQLKNRRIALEQAEKRGDTTAAENLKGKISVIEHLSGLVEKERRNEREAHT